MVTNTVPPIKIRPESTLQKNEKMAKWEIHKRAGNLLDALLWKHWHKHSVVIPWPRGWVVLHDDGQGGITSAESADPNDWYRPWLEKHCGRQRWSWEWRIASAADDTLEVRFRHSKNATWFALNYAK